MKIKNNLITSILALALAGYSTVPAAITIVNPGGANHTPFSICPAVDGANQLDPDPGQYLPPPGAGQGVLAELANGNTKFPGWNFNAGAALNGTLTISYYHSQFVGTHNSGAKIKAVYVPGAGDPATLRFVQMVETSDPLNGATSPYIDPFPNDDNLPFYWTEKENQKWGLTFSDFSKRFHPPNSFVTWRGNLYLASWNGATPGNVTVHDGVKWGFDAGCIEVEFISLILNSAITTLNNTFTLSWATNTPGAQVQTSTNLGASYWDPLTNTITLSNGLYIAQVPVTHDQQFFRLSFGNTNVGTPPTFQPAYLRVSPLPSTVEQGHEAYLSVKAEGSAPLAYQWFQNGSPIPNATNRDLTFTHVQFTNQGVYFATVTNAAGGDISDPAQLTLTPDTNAPTLVSAAASSNRLQITVTFSEPVDPSTALISNNYQVQRLSPPGTVLILNATQGSDQSIVILTPSAPLTPSAEFLLQASPAITDFATPPNHLSGGTTTFTTGP